MRNRLAAFSAGMIFLFSVSSSAQAPGSMPTNELGVVVSEPPNAIPAKIGVAWGRELKPSVHYSTAMNNLRLAMAQWTNIPVVLEKKVDIGDSVALEGCQILFVNASKSCELTKEEMHNLAEYIRNGGVIAYDGTGGKLLSDQIFWGLRRKEDSKIEEPSPLMTERVSQKIQDGENAGSVSYYAEMLPSTHEIYTTPFLLDEIPPGPNETVASYSTYRYSIGIFIKTMEKFHQQQVSREDGLAILILPRPYMNAWADSRREDALKFGVNLILFARDAVK